MKFTRRLFTLMALSVVTAALLAACGSDPTPTPVPTNTPVPVAAATPTTAPGVPTATPQPAATPTPAPSFDGDAYFAGQTIKMITGTSPGDSSYRTFRVQGSSAGSKRFLPRTPMASQWAPPTNGGSFSKPSTATWKDWISMAWKSSDHPPSGLILRCSAPSAALQTPGKTYWTKTSHSRPGKPLRVTRLALNSFH